MTHSTDTISVQERLRDRSRYVFLAADPEPAKDISAHLIEAADRIDTLEKALGKCCGILIGEDLNKNAIEDALNLARAALTNKERKA